MAIHSMFYAYCDTPGCELNVHRGTESEHQTRAQLVRELKAGSWSFKGRKHYCPDCTVDHDGQGSNG